MGHSDVIRSARWRFITVNGIDQFPSWGGMAESIEVESDEVVKEEALDLTTKDEHLGPEHV